MKLMLLVSSMGQGGAERVASTLVNAWRQRGDNVTLVATFSGHRECAYELSEGVRFLHLSCLVERTGRGPAALLERYGTLRTLIRAEAPDVVVSFLTNVNIAAIVASFGLRIPVIACEHNNPATDGRAMHWRLLARLIYPHASAVTLLTDSAAHSFATTLPRKTRLTVMPNPIPELPPGISRTTHASGRKRLLAAGRLCPQKQFDVLIESFAASAGQFHDWDLWIWGEGPDRASLEAAVAERGLQDRVKLPGRTNALWMEMQEADAFALSSRFEGLPMAMMEAMALGLPVVAFDCPSGPRELLRDGRDGLLVPFGDASAFAAALRSLMSDRALRQALGLAGAASVKERYSLRSALLRWDALFAQVIAGPAPLVIHEN
jgi:glycosyltransferase involved in cell wall biosynthesis